MGYPNQRPDPERLAEVAGHDAEMTDVFAGTVIRGPIASVRLEGDDFVLEFGRMAALAGQEDATDWPPRLSRAHQRRPVET